MKSPTTSVAKAAIGMGHSVLRVTMILATVAAVLAFYHWTVKSAQSPLEVRGQRNDYYNLLVDGFQEGHLYMKATPDPALLALPEGARPGNAPFLLDASLYRGRYYLYFGVVPAVTLFWPCAAFTGNDLPEGLAALIFAAVAFAFSVAWWLDVRRTFFPSLGICWETICILALGLGTILPSALRRPMFYEVAILSGWAFGMIGLWAVTRAWLSPRRAKVWLVLAGLAMGLAIGSRPNLAPAGLLVLVFGCAVVAWKSGEPAGRRVRRWIILLCFAGGGAGLIGAGLAGYNYARFGSVVEFGHSYQLGSNPQRMFRTTNLWHNLRIYYGAVPQVGAYFPFVAPAEESPKPIDYIGREHAHGEWVWSILSAGALVVMAGAWWRRREVMSAAWPVIGIVGSWFAINLLVTGLTGIRSNRYMVDFHPALVLGAVFCLSLGLSGRGVGRLLLRGVALLGLAVAVGFNALASMQVHGWFEHTAPENFLRLAKIADGAVWRAAPEIFAEVGDREIEVNWPAPDAAGPSPLVSAGPSGFDDGIWIETDGAKRARFVYQHWEYGTTDGPWFAIDRKRASRVRIAGAFLLPPPAHPWYAGRSDYERAALKRRLRVSVDGHVRFDRDVPSNSPAPWQVHWGNWRLSDGKLHHYESSLGRSQTRPVDVAWLAGIGARRGVVRLRLKLPAGHDGLVEPLLQTGTFPAYDVLMVRLVRPGFVQLIHDRFGAGAYSSPEFVVNYSQWQTVEIELPAAEDGVAWEEGEAVTSQAVDKLRVRWNGHEALVSPLGLHPTRSQDIVVGANLVGASHSRPLFAGELEIAPFLAPFAPIGSGVLESAPDVDAALVGTRGVILMWQRVGRPGAGVVWRRDTPDSRARLGWFDEGKIIWAEQLLSNDAGPLRVYLPRPIEGSQAEAGRGLVEVEQGGRPVLSALTYFFAEGAAPGWALDERRWTGFTQKSVIGAAVDELPGRIILRFALPVGGLAGGNPFLCVGVAGAADSVFLRAIGGGRYIFGLDHWGVGAVESVPTAVTPGEVHTLEIELGSLFTPGQVDAKLVRLKFDETVVLDAKNALHPVKPGQVVVGRNPLGMSTSRDLFGGVIYSVRMQQPAGK